MARALVNRLVLAVTVASALLLASLGALGCGSPPAADPRKGEARTQVQRWAEKLDGQTTETGVYIRHPAPQLPEDDPWGTPLAVVYTQDGAAESLVVRSAGPDRIFHTDDDIETRRAAVNFKGVGQALDQNIEESSRKSARGAVKGAAEGIKEAVRDSLMKKKAKDQE